MLTDGPVQQELALPFPELTGDQPLLPARMVNEYVYCPRLAYLEWVQGEWADSADTVDGRRQHRRVDAGKDTLPPAEAVTEDSRIHARSVTLSSNRYGLVAKLDLIEADEGRVVPVDYKRGKRPHVAKAAYDPERVQLCLQGMKQFLPLAEPQNQPTVDRVAGRIAAHRRGRTKSGPPAQIGGLESTVAIATYIAHLGPEA